MILKIGERIQYLRDKAGLTQTDLSKKLGISRSAVNSWEMGLSFPSINNLIEMTKIFGVSADYILSLSDHVLIDISSLDGEEQEILLKLLACFRHEK